MAEDPLVIALRDSQAPVVTLVAKSYDRHVELALKTTLRENLAMIADTIEFLRAGGQRVFLDAEHFFDGYLSDPHYAIQVVRTAMEAGADLVALCDTNGGMLPDQIGEIVTATMGTGARLGVHCHDDSACGVANTLAAVDAGVTHVQGTANGYGERAGNANLFSVLAGLQLKKGFQVVSGDRLGEMSRIAAEIGRIVNVPLDSHQPYVGSSAFAHKAGLHASAVKVDPMLYQHIDPLLVGNDMKMIISDMAGRASVELKGRELGIDVTSDRAVIGRVAEQVKDLEAPRLHLRVRRRVLRAATAHRTRRTARVLHREVVASYRGARRGRRREQPGHGQGQCARQHDRRGGRGAKPGQGPGQCAACRAGADISQRRGPGPHRLPGPARLRHRTA